MATEATSAKIQAIPR